MTHLFLFRTAALDADHGGRGKLTTTIRLFMTIATWRGITNPKDAFVTACLHAHAEKLVRATCIALGGSEGAALNGLQWVYLCRVVRNELSETPAYAAIMAPLLPEGASLGLVLAGCYQRIVQEVAERLDLSEAGGAKQAREAADLLNKALLEAGQGELEPIDFAALLSR